MTLYAIKDGVRVALTPEEAAEIAASSHYVSRSDVNTERDRRIAFGRVVTLTSGKVVPIQGRPQDQTNLLGLVTLAQMRAQANDTTPTTFRDRANVDHSLTPVEVVELWTRGVAYFELVMQAAWALKDLDPIPDDFADDVHWPNASQPNSKPYGARLKPASSEP